MPVGQVFDFSLNDSSLVGMFAKINSFTDVGQGGILGIFILLVVGGVMFMMMKAYGNEKALSVTMLVTSIIGLFLRILGLIADFVFYICIVLFVVGIIFMIKDSEKYD
jgi:hypothetical protein